MRFLVRAAAEIMQCDARLHQTHHHTGSVGATIPRKESDDSRFIEATTGAVVTH
jgi:hypothetical protein